MKMPQAKVTKCILRNHRLPQETKICHQYLYQKKRKIVNEDSCRLDKAFKILESAASASAGTNESQSFGQFVGKKLETYNQKV